MLSLYYTQPFIGNYKKKKKKVERALNTLAHEIHLSYHNLQHHPNHQPIESSFSLSPLFSLHSLFIFFSLSINSTAWITMTSLQTTSTLVPLFLHHNLQEWKKKLKTKKQLWINTIIFFLLLPIFGENQTTTLTSFT